MTIYDLWKLADTNNNLYLQIKRTRDYFFPCQIWQIDTEQRGKVLEPKTDVITCSKRPVKFFTAQIIIFKQLLTL